MAIVWRCPRCQEAAGAPEGLAATDTLRCPHCEACFPWAEAVPFEAASEEPSPEPAVAFTLCHDEAAPAAASLDLLVRCPHCLAEAALGELTVAATGEPLDAGILAEALAAPADAEPLPHASLGLATVASSPAVPTAAWTRQAPSGKSLVGQAIGIVLGGLLAIPLAYYILNAVGGEAFDWLSVPLPGVRHTYRHLPNWWHSAAPAPQPRAPGEAGDSQGPG